MSNYERFTLSSAKSVAANTDAYKRGFDYLHQVQKLALDARMVDVMDNVRDRILICTWIGQHIEAVNLRLNNHLDACHACFHPEERRAVQILAAPLALSFGLDGLCNIQTQPITLLIDVGRVAVNDWLALVAHEYAHAHLGHPGHDQHFFKVLTHLCLGLGLQPPIWQPDLATYLRHWPPYTSIANPLPFWMGQTPFADSVH
jgi:hypothetical protein